MKCQYFYVLLVLPTSGMKEGLSGILTETDRAKRQSLFLRDLGCGYKCSAVGNMHGLTADPPLHQGSPVRSRPGPLLFFGHSPPFRYIIQDGLLLVSSEGMCTKEKVWLCGLTVPP